MDIAGNVSEQHYVLNVMMDIGHLDEEVQFAFEKGWITNPRAQSGKKIDAAFANTILADIAYLKNLH